MDYATPKQAIEAASKLPSGEATGLAGAECIRYVSIGRGGVVRVERYCNEGGGKARTTHKERIVRPRQ